MCLCGLLTVIAIPVNPFQPIVAFRIETSHPICRANQMTDFHMKCSTELKWINGMI